MAKIPCNDKITVQKAKNKKKKGKKRKKERKHKKRRNKKTSMQGMLSVILVLQNVAVIMLTVPTFDTIFVYLNQMQYFYRDKASWWNLFEPSCITL